MSFVACTRMYDVTPEVRRHWHALMRLAAGAAGIAIECIDHAPPAPLTELWTRDDLVLGYMCGLPLATRYPDVQPLAAPVTGISDDQPTYRSVWLVRADSAFDTLASTFGRRIGWTVEHSHSGFNAPRYALLAHRSAARPTLYRESVGPLGDPHAALAALAEERIDVTAIDAYWWWLFERRDRTGAATYRVIGETASAPMPPLICAPGLARSLSTQLVDALEEIHRQRSAAVHLDALGVRRFVPVARADYAVLAELDRAARESGYLLPA